jgi:hypothetical protein
LRRVDIALEDGTQLECAEMEMPVA